MYIPGIIHGFSINDFFDNLRPFIHADSLTNLLSFFESLEDLKFIYLLNQSLIIEILIKRLVPFELVLVHFQVNLEFPV